MTKTGLRGWLDGLARNIAGRGKRGERPARRLALERLEDRLTPAAVVVNGTAGDNTLVVNAAGPDSGSYSLNGGPAVPFADCTSFTFNGGPRNNAMTVNDPSGGLFAPSGGVFFLSSSGLSFFNTLTVQGGAAVAEVFDYTIDGSANGEFALLNGSTSAAYTFPELGTELINAGTPQNVVFNLPETNIELRLGAPTSTIFGTTFPDPAQSLTVNAISGAATTISALPTSAIPIPSVTLNGGPGFDTFDVQAASGGAITINGGSSGSVLNFEAGGRPIGATPGALTRDGLPSVVYNNVPVINLNNAAGVNALYGPNTVALTTLHFFTPDLNPQEGFVDELYLGALGRPGSRSDLDAWAAVFNTPGLSQGQAQTFIASGIEHSAEARDHLVQSWYGTYLGRKASGGEEQGFVSELLAGQTEERVLSQILASPEFYARAQTLGLAGTADQQFVQALYRLVLDRAAAPSEVAGWVGALPSLGRQGAALAFLQSSEFRTDQFEGYYNALLHRPDDQPGLNNWVMSNLDMGAVRIAFESTPESFQAGAAIVQASRQDRIA